MTILGIIAAAMIAVLKPSQYNKQGFDTLKRKVYSDLDRITQTIIVECAQDGDAAKIFENCDRTLTPHTFGSDSGSKETALYSNYMKGTIGACESLSGYTNLKLKNGVCVYFGENKIKVDVNGNKKPNDSTDQFCSAVTSDGIALDINDIGGTTCDDNAPTCTSPGDSLECCMASINTYYSNYSDRTCTAEAGGTYSGLTYIKSRCVFPDSSCYTIDEKTYNAASHECAEIPFPDTPEEC